MRRVVELHWPALLAGAACGGLALSNWVSVGRTTAAALALTGLLGVGLLDGPARVVALGVALAAVGLWWGALRMEVIERSWLAGEVDGSGQVEVVTTGPARRTSWAVRVPAEVHAFRGRRLRERALLVLPVGRSPPRGAILQARVRVAEPRSAENGFDERAWLARQGIHVVLRASSWQQVGRRGGIAGLGDRLRDRIEEAVGRGTTGVRRGLVLGVVLGEDEGLPDSVRADFRASGLYHLLSEYADVQNTSRRRNTMDRLPHSHSLGGGLVLGLLVAQRPLWIFAAGVVVGIALVFAVRTLRKLLGAVRIGARLLERLAGQRPTTPLAGDQDAALPPTELSELEREQERRIGLRQGEAAGIRAAARIESHDRARREAMLESSARFGRELGRQSLERALTSDGR